MQDTIVFSLQHKKSARHGQNQEQEKNPFFELNIFVLNNFFDGKNDLFEFNFEIGKIDWNNGAYEEPAKRTLTKINRVAAGKPISFGWTPWLWTKALKLLLQATLIQTCVNI